ncbi:MAG: hypothetical protein ACOC9Z_06325 [Chloroflexota bacterium]
MVILDETTTRRLILIRQLHLRGTDHANDPTEIGRVLAIQILDYAVEMLLKTIVSYLGSPNEYPPPENGYYYKIKQLQGQRYNPAKLDFYRLWDEVTAVFRSSDNDVLSESLPLRRDMNIMHQIRNDIQHNGVVPARSEVRKYAAYTESFVREVTLEAFALDLQEVTLASLIEDPELQPLLSTAEKELEGARYRKSIISATTAFELATRHERLARPPRRRLSSFTLRNNIQRLVRDIKAERVLGDFARKTGVGWSEQRTMERLGKELTQAYNTLGEIFEDFLQELEDLREGMDVITLGGDLRRYQRFRLLSPRLFQTFDGEWHVGAPEGWEPTKEDAIEVLSFVFDTILRWQQLPLNESDR